MPPIQSPLPKLAGQFGDWLTTAQIDRYGLTYGELKAIPDYLREILQRFDQVIISIQDAIIEFQEKRRSERRSHDVRGLALREARRFDETIKALRCAIAVYHKIGDL
jgi:hypothetical protein